MIIYANINDKWSQIWIEDKYRRKYEFRLNFIIDLNMNDKDNMNNI